MFGRRARCPKCGSKRITFVKYMDIKAVVCGGCGYDETDELALAETSRNNQREKRRHNIYRSRM